MIERKILSSSNKYQYRLFYFEILVYSIIRIFICIVRCIYQDINSQNSSCVRVEILIIRDIRVVIEYLLFVLIIGIIVN